MNTPNQSTDTGLIITIDCNYLFPQFAASYLMIEGDQAAFIETNTVRAIPRLLSALEENNITPEQVAYIIVTHVHLDHSGGAASLARMCPNATILAHEKAAKHIIDPEKLIHGATAVYGEHTFNKLYGDIDSIDESRVHIMNDRETMPFGSRELEFIYTAGHAWHHLCIFDSKTRSLFSGDAFGLSFPAINTGHTPFVFPSTSPTGFNADEARKSIQKILATDPKTIFLTHYGSVTEIEKFASMLLGYIDDMEAIISLAKETGFADNDLEQFCIEKVKRFFKKELEQRGLELSGEILLNLDMDIRLNGQGLAWVVEQMEK